MATKKEEIKKFKALEAELRKTANTASSSSARKSADSDLAKIRETRLKMESELNKERLGRDDANLVQREGGAVSRGLDALSTPLYLVTGAVESALGKGEGNLVDNMIQNVKDKDGFTELLKSYNLPNVASLPAGIALDIMFDPLTWATAGTASLGGRVIAGGAKAGVKGAAKGASSRSLELASKIAKPLESIKFSGVKGKGAISGKEMADALTSRSLRSSDDYFKMIGKGSREERMNELLSQRREDRLAGKALYNKAITKLEEYPRAERLVNKFRFNDGDGNWYQMKKAEEEVRNAMGMKDGFYTTSAEMAQHEIDVLNAVNKRLKELKSEGVPTSQIDDIIAVENQIRRDMNAGLRLADGTLDYSPATYLANPERASEALNPEALSSQNVNKMLTTMKKLMVDETGIDWWDNMLKTIKASKKGENKIYDGLNSMLKAHDVMITAFKNSKIGLSPTAYMNATLGNPAMFAAHTNIETITDPQYAKYVLQAFRNSMGNVKGKDVDSLLDTFRDYAEKYPELFKSIYGIDRMFLSNIDDAKNLLMEFGINNIEGVKLQKFAKEASELTEDQLAAFRQIFEADSLKSAADASKAAGEGTSTMIVGELRSRHINSVLEKMEVMMNAADSTPAQKKLAEAVLWYFSKPMGAYEKIDQAYRLGTGMFLTRAGVSEDALTRMSRFTDISPEDIKYNKKTGKFTLTPDKASEVVLDVYMNYAAMPAAVRMIRQMPFFGSPFASFMYGMADKTARAAVYNPQVFNQYEIMLNSLADLAPEYQKDAIKNSEYHEFYGNKGMMRLPFFRDNPVYLNIANMIPWYSMNIFDSVDRGYENSFGGKVAELVDRSPFLKTPEGQLMLDYMILPILYQDAENVRGAFGQRVAPKDASPLERAAYGIRSAAEVMTPGVAGLPLGLSGAIAPLDEFAQAIPSYRGRAISNALYGRDADGVMRQEPAARRTARNIAGWAGINTYTPNFDYSLDD